jgi:aspartate kinase
MVVLKFGGTSVENADAIDRVLRIVTSRASEQPVVVVSALAGVTDQLLATANSALAGDLVRSLKQLASMRERHESLVRALLSEAADEVLPHLAVLFDELEGVLRGIAALRQLTPRTTDQVASFGERLSSAILVAALRHDGLAAELVDSRECIVTNDRHTEAEPIIDLTYERVAARVLPVVEQGIVPVLPGFIAATVEGATTTLSRGGSDFTAALVGAALQADRIEIWTDTDGVLTADPRVEPAARTVESLSFDEAATCAAFGAKVLHPATLWPARQKGIPVHVLNSLRPGHRGTRVGPASHSRRQRCKSIAIKQGIASIDITAADGLRSDAFLQQLFTSLEQHGCTTDLVCVADRKVSALCDARRVTDELLADLASLGGVRVRRDLAIVCLIGERLRDYPEITAHLLALNADLEIQLVAQGPSEVSVAVALSEGNAAKAVRRLHRAFFENSDAVLTPPTLGVLSSGIQSSLAAD